MPYKQVLEKYQAEWPRKKSISICLLGLLVWTSFFFSNNPSFNHVRYRFLPVREFFFNSISSWFLKNTTVQTHYFCESYPDHGPLHCILCHSLILHFTIKKKDIQRDKISFPVLSNWTSDALTDLMWLLFIKHCTVLVWVHDPKSLRSSLPMHPATFFFFFCPENGSTWRIYNALISANLMWTLSASVFWAGYLNSPFPRNVLEATNLVQTYFFQH